MKRSTMAPRPDQQPPINHFFRDPDNAQVQLQQPSVKLTIPSISERRLIQTDLEDASRTIAVQVRAS